MTRNVLVVDDSDSVRQLMGIVLRGEGYGVLEAGNGCDAITKLRGHKIHLIISDVNMPCMDGLAFIKEVRSLPSHKFTPVIMLTADTSGQGRQAARDAGAKAWMVKPFERGKLLDMVSRFIQP